MTVPRESVLRWVRTALTAALWLSAVSLVQSTVGHDIAQGVRDGEQRIELRMRERRDPPSGSVQPPRTNEESIEPWELVSV